MTIIRNISAGVQTIPSLGGTLDVAAGADVNLLEVVDGEPLNFQVDLERSKDLRLAIESGNWRVVTAAGDELGEAGSLEALVPASQAAVSCLISKRWHEITPNPGNNAWFDVLEIPVADGKAVAVGLRVHIRKGSDSSMDVGSTPLTFTSRRRTGGSVVTPRPFAIDQSEGGIRFQIDDRATSVVIQARRRGTGTVFATYTGTLEEQV